MSADTITADPHESRYEAHGTQKIHATIERTEGTDAIEDAAKLLDISRNSIKLESSSSPSIQEAVIVGVKAERLGLNLSLPAVVRWVRPGQSKTFRLGCAFSEPLAEQTLARLATAGYLQRRQERRFEASIDGYVRWEASSEKVPAKVTNISAGGFCLCIPETEAMGERLLLEIESGEGRTARVSARVRWKSEIERGRFTNTRYFFMGCSFTDPGSFETLRNL